MENSLTRDTDGDSFRIREGTRAPKWPSGRSCHSPEALPAPRSASHGAGKERLCSGYFQLLYSSYSKAAHRQGDACVGIEQTPLSRDTGLTPRLHTLQFPCGGLRQCRGCSLCYTESLPTWLLIHIRANVSTGVIFSGMISDCLPLPCYHGD